MKREKGLLHARDRRVVFTLLFGTLLLAYARAHAEDTIHYQPPPVDYVYPASLDGGIEEPAYEGTDAGLAPLPPLDASAPEPVPSVTFVKLDASLPSLSALPPVVADDDYGAQATVQRAATSGTREVSLESARDLPGAFGDPLRVLEALPGVVPIASGVPYAYVRGSPPASQGYVYDDIPLPQLFHAAFGPAIIHPRATGAMRFNAGVPSARYGRRAGGLLLAQGTPYSDKFDAELELRLIDVGGWVEGPLLGGQAMASGRIGYPKLALLAAERLGAVNEGTRLNYWDGQVRYRYPLGARDRVELVWIGSFDDVALPGFNSLQETGTTRLQFHRIETRYTHQVARGEIGSALRFGFDQSELGNALEVKAFTFGPRFWSDLKFGRQRLRIGGDIFASQGDVINKPGSLGSPDGDLRISLPRIASAPARNQGGLQAEAELRVGELTRLTLGARLDYWSVLSDIDIAFDPRLRAAVDATEQLEFHAAFGLAHQPAVFFLPLPGLTDVALDRGLTRAIQAEVGASYELPLALHIEAQGFIHKYTDLLLPELVMDASIDDDPPLSDALAYGVEFFLKRDLGEAVTGWLSYTLGWAVADSQSSIGRFQPDFDVRHVLNAVLRWSIGYGFQLGGRLHARSGRVIEQLNLAYKQRLPWFVRGDVRFGYSWRGRFADMVAYVEWLNVAARGEYLDADCLLTLCKASQAPPISIPNLGVRAEF